MTGSAEAGRRGERGIALMTVLVLLAIMASVVVAVTPAEMLGISVSREQETRRQLAYLVRVISGSTADQTFGFVGDVGRLPKSLQELNATAGPHTLCSAGYDPSVVAYHTADGATNHRGGTAMGWNGPYVREMFATGDYLVDAWGQTLQYTCPESTKPGTDPTTSGTAMTLRTGTITSAGPDGVFATGDDIISDPFYDRGNLILTIKVGNSQATPDSVTVTLFYPVNGEQASITTDPQTLETVSGAQKVLPFASVPAGVRFVSINMGTRNEVAHVTLESNVANAREYILPQN